MLRVSFHRTKIAILGLRQQILIVYPPAFWFGELYGYDDINGEAMLAAAEDDEDIADFLYRANDWQGTWLDSTS